jgi:hypothetical protein
MIFHPRIGQRVGVHYARRAAAVMPYHGMHGLVRVVSRGRGPRNVGVEIDGRLVVIPRGNLVVNRTQQGKPLEVDAGTEIAPVLRTGAMEVAI